ncbi:MAG: ZIP family metal transporter [Lachnospiraceae bacterium]|nr:ZIP family metal transporter [Lachnospiraceae bacterium]
MNINVIIGIMIPFIGTTLGAMMVFFLKNEMKERVGNALSGFASGVMVAASVWSLLIPAIEMAEESVKGPAFLPAAIGFLAGMAFLLLLDTLIPHLHVKDDEPEGMKSSLKKQTMLVLAVTLHNIPEGMAVGVVFAGLIAQNELISMSGAIALALGIAIQNFPEGAIISMPLKSTGVSKKRAFSYGMLSGIVEPIASFVTILLAGIMTPILPFLLAFSAGAMIYVVVEELIPESQTGKHSNIGTIGFALGFVLMMILDVALG